MFSKFTSASSIANIDMVLDNFQSYEISIDSINVFMLSLLFIFILFLFIYKEDNKRFIERLRYFVPMLLIAVPFVVIYLLCYHDQLFLDLLLFPKRHKFPSFIDNFGYVFYRYEDIMVVIESLGG